MTENTNYNQPQKPEYFDEEESSFDIMEWVRLFLHHWYLLAAGLVVGLGAAYYVNRSWTPQIATEMKMIVEDNSSTQYSFMSGFSAGGNYRNNNNQLFLLHSYNMMRKTVESLPFDVEYYTRGRFKTTSLYGRNPIKIDYSYLHPEVYNYEFTFEPIGTDSFSITTTIDEKPIVIKGAFDVPFEHSLMFATVHREAGLEGRSQFFFRFRSVISLEEEFFARLAVGWADEMSSVLSISLVSNNPARDVDFLNMLAAKYIESNLEKKNAEAVRTIEFIDGQLVSIAEALSDSEGKLRTFRRENNIIDVNSYMGDVMSKMSDLAELRVALDQKERYFNYLSNYLKDNIVEDVLVAPTSIGVSDPTLLDLVNQYNKLQLDRSEIGVKNPNYERYTKQMQQVRGMLLEVLRNVRSVYDLDRASYEEEYQRALAETRALPEKENMLINMERDYKINDTYYTFLLQKRSEAQIRKASNVPDNSVLQEARVGSLVNGGTTSKNYMKFILVGLLIPAAFIVLRELLNFTIRTPKDISKITRFPIIGSVRHTKMKPENPVLSTLSPKSAFTESLRAIRTRLEMIAQRKTSITTLITSAESGDGKTYFSVNLAGVCSLVSPKTLLIDLDLRKPTVGAILDRQHKGLVNYLIDEISLDEAVFHDEQYGFDLLLAGTIPPNPGELIQSEKLHEALEILKKRYDYIIIDTSPLGLVSDAFTITQQVDANLLVARSEKTNKSFFKTFVERITEDKITHAYVVLNDVDLQKMNKYGYGYGYGYGYYAGNKKSKKHKNNYYVHADFEEDDE